MLPLADMVWPALVFAGGAWTWWAIAGGFLVELPLYRWATGLAWGETIALTLVANLITATVGFVALTLFDFAWAFTGVGTFGMATFVASYIGYTIVNTAVEFGCIRIWTKRRKLESRRNALAKLFLANALSVALAFFAMTKSPNAEKFTPPWGPHAPYESMTGAR